MNITWLADMNYAVTSRYAAANVGGTGSNQVRANGRMGWDAAMNWADGLAYGGFDDWRLASMNAADTTCSHTFNPGGGLPTQYYGYNCTGGELSHLFVADLGNKAGESVLNQTGDTAEQIANMALFSNVQPGVYWSGLEYAPSPSVAWYFGTGDGSQNFVGKHNALYAVAVRPGDVAATVSEPHTLALVVMSFGAAMLARRKRPL